jgi:hypothetical protein
MRVKRDDDEPVEPAWAGTA